MPSPAPLARWAPRACSASSFCTNTGHRAESSPRIGNKKTQPEAGLLLNGAKETRTPDPLHACHASQANCLATTSQGSKQAQRLDFQAKLWRLETKSGRTIAQLPGGKSTLIAPEQAAGSKGRNLHLEITPKSRHAEHLLINASQVKAHGQNSGRKRPARSTIKRTYGTWVGAGGTLSCFKIQRREAGCQVTCKRAPPSPPRFVLLPAAALRCSSSLVS